MLDIKKDLMEIIPPEKILINQSLAPYTTFKIGGPAGILLLPSTNKEIKHALEISWQKKLPYYVLGRGSNVLIDDKGLKGLVIYLGENYQSIEVNGHVIRAKSGVSLKEISVRATANGLAGLEFARGIPGSLGGAVYMNAGAFDCYMQNLVENVVTLTDKGKIVYYSRPEIEFDYRWSSFQQKSEIILEVTLSLQKGKKDWIEQRMQEMMQRRESKQPLEYPSAGSIFKRPEGYFAGKLIQDSGLKGYTIGGAQVSQKHSGFIVNKGNATSEDVKKLVDYIQNTVYQKFGVQLERELKYLD